MLTEDIVVYAAPEGKDYVALIDGTWSRWPAEAGGWALRQRCKPELAAQCQEYDAFHADLALRLSGVTADV